MDDGHVLGTQHLVDGMLLRLVEIGEVHVAKGKGLGLHRRCVEEVAQIAQSATGSHGALQCVEHHAVAGLVERQLHANALLLKVAKRKAVWHADHHAVAIDVRNSTLSKLRIEN